MSRADTSSLTEQLQRGFHGLRFEGELESAYRRDQFHERLRYLRINLAVLAVISLVVIQVDRVVMPLIGRIVPDLARTGVMLPLLLAGFAITFVRRADAWYPRYIAAAMTVALGAMSLISVTAFVQGEPRVFARMLLAIIAVYFVLGLPFRSAIAVNALALAVYAAVAVSKAMPAVDLTHYLLTLAIANVICIAGAYNLEHARRTAWLEGQRLAETAMQDGLTGIPNRRRFDDHLQRVWSQCVRERKPIALLLADIDHFKAYNDRYGHQAGDEALKAVAGVLTRFARRPLDLAARYGGEEFAIILFDAKREHAGHIGEEILDAVRRLAIPHQDSGVAPVLTISLGIACVVPAARRSWAGLVQLADQALYAAKDGGRNRVQVYDPASASARHREMRWMARLTHARDEGRLDIMFQPIVRVAASAKDRPHYELLLRLHDENGAMVLPDEFIPAAERFNLMPSLDRWVIEKVLRDYVPSARDGVEEAAFTVAVNLSGTTLSDPSFLEFLIDVLEAHEPTPMLRSASSTAGVSTRSATVSMPIARPICTIASTIARSIGSVATFWTKLPSIFR